MKIVILDRVSIGFDTPLSVLNKFGQVEVFDSSTPDEAILRSVDAEVVIINKVKVTRALIESASKLKLICIFATGYDNIDLNAAREKGIAVCNVPGYSTDSVTLFTISTVLALCSHLLEYNAYVKSGEYTSSGIPNKLTPICHDLSGKIWGIVGYGNIGRAVGKVAEAFGARVVVNKRTPIDDVDCVDIETLCRESDIITIHCPLNGGTRHLINREMLSLMKPSVILVNEARGAVLDEAAVADALLTKKIGGFGCDVYSEEPFSSSHPYNSILHHNNVILTPHAAWGSYEARERCINIIAENIDSFISDKTLNRVDK